MKKNKKIAIVYDWLDKWGGVERILLTLHTIFPDAPFYTSYYDKKKASWAKHLLIHQSFIGSMPSFIKENRLLSLPFYPYAFESFQFNTFDTVISVTSSFAKSVITQPGTQHICYLLTPTRFLWNATKDYGSDTFPASLFKKKLQDWDRIVSNRPDNIISISETVKKRCSRFYGLHSDVVYPPFDHLYWDKITSMSDTMPSVASNEYYLVVSRLEPYKRVDIVIDAFNITQKKLIVVGTGTQTDRLRSRAKRNISFLSGVSDQQLVGLYSHAEALIMPQEEDFGYVAVEAQYAGCPVISYGKGGATEIIQHDKTGLFFPTQSTQSLLDALERFHTMSYNLKEETRRSGKEFGKRHSKAEFQKKLLSLIH